MKNLTELVFILDKSGSMSGLEKDTIGGFNSLLKKQQKEKGDALVSTVLFDDETSVVHDRVPIGKVRPMTDADYMAGGCTALLDALGNAICHIGRLHKKAKKAERPEHTLFVIITDGEENSSREYRYSDVRRLVERQRDKYGWEFIFLGANMDAIAAASRFGIQADRAATYECDEAGTALNFLVVEKAARCIRGGKKLSAAWKSDIETDRKRRRKNND